MASDLDRHQSLHVSNVGQRTGQVAMLRVAFLKVFDGAGEKLKRFLVVPLAANHASVGRVDVAERDVIVGGAQVGLGLVEDAGGVAVLALLKKQPAFE